ncbi:MAG TPA: energy transducer TonB [Novosphingobium sp.]|nr:energy transducer TonB [Novosphingobium sp.]
MSASTVPKVAASGFATELECAPAPQCPRDAYRVGGRPARTVAVLGTVLLHLAVGAVVAIGWPRTETEGGAPHLVSVIVLPRAADQPRRRPTSGTRTPESRPDPLPVVSSPPPTILLAPPTPTAGETVAELPAPAEGGHEDALAMATQAYRRAVMARLEAQRRPLRHEPAEGGQGAVVFRIERGGRLLEASMAPSTGLRSLDRAALSTVRRAAPFPAIPDALPDELAITLPVEFLGGPHRAEVAAR